MRLIVGGGRAAETSDSKGAVVVGVRTLSEGGRVGNFSREQVFFFLPCSYHILNRYIWKNCENDCFAGFVPFLWV